MIEAWKTRGKIPVAVEGTLNILRAMVQDPHFSTEASVGALDAESLRSLYALTLLRTLNLLTDQAQKGAVAASVESLARGMGIPSWLVDLRHEAAHAPLPPTLHALRVAVSWLLDWLFNRYWHAQHEAIPDNNKSTPPLLDSVYKQPEISLKQLRTVCMQLNDEADVIAWIIKTSNGQLDRQDIEKLKFLVHTFINRLSEQFALNLVIAFVKNPNIVLRDILLEISSQPLLSHCRVLARHALTVESLSLEQAECLVPLLEISSQQFLYCGMGRVIDGYTITDCL